LTRFGLEIWKVSLLSRSQAEIDNIKQDGFWFGLPEFTLEAER